MASSVRANYVPPSPSATPGKRRWNGNKEAKEKHRNSKKSKLNGQFQVDLTLEDEPLVVSFKQIIKQLETAQNLSRERLEECESLREENGVIKAQLDLADSEVHKLNGELKTLMEEKNVLQAKLGNPTTEPEIFYGVPGKFIPWRAHIESYLRENPGKFPMAKDRIAYVLSRLSMYQKRQLDPYLRQGAIKPFRDVQDILQHLAGLYPRHRSNSQVRGGQAYQEYSNLKMKPYSNFAKFHHTFVDLANKAHIPCNARLGDFFEKLNPSMQKRMANDRSTNFECFVKACFDQVYG